MQKKIQLHRMAVTLALALSGLATAATPGRADFLFYNSLAGYQAGLASFGLRDSAVSFVGPGTVAGPAPTLTGRVDATNSLINITGAGENLVAQTSGMGLIREADGGTLPRSSFTMAGSGFPLDALAFFLDPNQTTSGTFTLTATDQFGRHSALVEGAAPGPLFFGVIATNNEVISLAVLTTSGNSANSLSQLRAGTLVPEPSSLVLCGIAGVGLVLAGVRRKINQASPGVLGPG